jgi:hypothetical protein
MASQSVIHSVPQSKSAVSTTPKKLVPKVSQRELIEIIMLRNLLREREESLSAFEAEIKARLDAGASVEPGVHVASLKESFRRTVAWKSVAVDLGNAVFGEGKGAAYCEDVLNSTEPERSVSLFIR